MAFTGDLEYLGIVDIIQLIHTTRKSGIFSIKTSTSESRLVFSNGSIVGANHINNSVRIGSVLVKMGSITVNDLKEAIAAAKQSDASHLPLLAELVRMGRLKRDDAIRGLKKLVELTIVELIGWTKGTFTFDSDTVIVPSDGEQGLGVDAQMVLMDALRISDERERDRQSGKEVPSLTALYEDVLPGENAGGSAGGTAAITADILGLADLDRLEKRMPRPAADMEVFDPVEIHRRKVKELLPGVPSNEQEAFFSFLKTSLERKAGPDAGVNQSGKAVVLFSSDALTGHAVLSLCSSEGVLAFTTDRDTELDRMISQCLVSARMPLVVFDGPAGPDGPFSRQGIEELRNHIRGKFSTVPVLQFATHQDIDFILQSYRDGVRAVLPKPSNGDRKQTFVTDMMGFLGAFRSAVSGFQYGRDDADIYGKKLKDSVMLLRGLTNPSDAALVILTAVSDMFERAATLIVRGADLIGERSIGISMEKSMGPAPADKLKLSLTAPSAVRDVIEKGKVFYGESTDEGVRAIFAQIGKPKSPAILLLPLMSDRKVVAVIYGDFGQKDAAPVRIDMLEIISAQAGIALEYALFRRHAAKASAKP